MRPGIDAGTDRAGAADDLDDLAPWQRAIVCSVSGEQHRRLLVHLCRHGRASCSALEAGCDVRSVTSRVAEMRRRGLPVEPTHGHEPDRRGRSRRATFYEITGPLPQRDLFDLHA